MTSASRGAHQPDIGFQLKCIERSNVFECDLADLNWQLI